MPKEIPHGFPPMRGIQHQIDLIPGLVFPNKLASMKSPKEHEEFKTQVDDFLDKGLVQESESSYFIIATGVGYCRHGPLFWFRLLLSGNLSTWFSLYSGSMDNPTDLCLWSGLGLAV